MIRGFADKATQSVFDRRRSKRLPVLIQRQAHRKFLQIHAASRIETLRVPPGNHLERLSGDRAGQYSIRINRRWRICFEWRDGDAYDVEIADYH